MLDTKNFINGPDNIAVQKISRDTAVYILSDSEKWMQQKCIWNVKDTSSVLCAQSTELMTSCNPFPMICCEFQWSSFIVKLVFLLGVFDQPIVSTVEL